MVGGFRKLTSRGVNKKGRITSRNKQKKKNKHSFSKKEANLFYERLGDNHTTTISSIEYARKRCRLI